MTLPLLLLALQSAPTSGLPPDPRLDAPLAIEARIEPLPELLDKLGRKLGIELTLQRRMDGLKATVFTGERPARLTLGALASVFDGVWTPTKEGYRLEESVPAANRLAAYRDAEREANRLAMEWEIEHSMMLSELKDHLPPSAREALWRGEDVVVPLEGYHAPLPPPEPDGGQRHPHTHGFLRYDPETGGMRYLFTDGGGISAGYASGDTSPVPERANLYRASFRTALNAWETDLERKDVPEFALPLETVPLPPLPWPMDSYGHPAKTTSDVLLLLHRQSGVPIVAEAFRTDYFPPYVLFPGPTLGAALRGWNWRKLVRIEGGTLLFRPWEYWQTRLTEPLEAALRTFEATPGADLESVAHLYASLTPSAARALESRVLRHRLDAYRGSALALRAWGLLSPAARKAALAGAILRFVTLSPAARQAVEAAARGLPFDRWTPKADLAFYERTPGTKESDDWIIRAETKGVVYTSPVYRDAEGGKHEFPDLPGVRLIFGPEGKERANAVVPVRTTP